MSTKKNQHRSERTNSSHARIQPSSTSTKAQLSFLLNDEHNGQPQYPMDMSSSSLTLRDSSWRRQPSGSAFPTNRGSRISSFPDPAHVNSDLNLMNKNTDLDYQDHSTTGTNTSFYNQSSTSLSQMPRLRDQMNYSTSGHSSAMDISHITSTGSAINGASSSERRGVRKKRQRKFVCETCGFGFYTNSDLQKHVSSVHLLLRPYECSMCDKKFGERSNATKHFKSVHERQKNAECEICHKVFAFRDGLVRHKRLVHDNIRNFHCKYPGCGQSFKQSAHLKKHQQVHSKSRQSSTSSSSRVLHSAGVYASTNGAHRGQVLLTP